MSTQRSAPSVPVRYTARTWCTASPSREVLGEVVRVAGRRRDRVERRPPGDAVVAVVEVAAAEEHRGGVGAQHDFGPELAHVTHDRAAQLAVVDEIAVGVLEVANAGDAEHRGRGLAVSSSRSATSASRSASGSLRPLLALRRDEQPNLGCRRRPTRASVPPAEISGSSGWA